MAIQESRMKESSYLTRLYYQDKEFPAVAKRRQVIRDWFLWHPWFGLFGWTQGAADCDRDDETDDYSLENPEETWETWEMNCGNVWGFNEVF